MSPGHSRARSTGWRRSRTRSAALDGQMSPAAVMTFPPRCQDTSSPAQRTGESGAEAPSPSPRASNVRSGQLCCRIGQQHEQRGQHLDALSQELGVGLRRPALRARGRAARARGVGDPGHDHPGRPRLPHPRARRSALLSQDFPGAHRGDWVREDSGGNWYALGGEECWLCPALGDYFPEAPAHLYVRARSLEEGRPA